MNELANCPKCDRLFVKSLRAVCRECHQEVEEMFDRVYTFVKKRENRMAVMSDVTEATGVEELQIIRFVKEGRIHLAHMPNVMFPCEGCGKSIREGRICGSCRSGIRSGLERVEQEERFASRKREDENRANTYHSVTLNKKR
ncbi:TIGR03826 family flagellar region protein [Alteribacter aurantiacus]|uniref:TIGR03826 family flagellar region protein n=1 Tax=Alteribacter aurantiacus TaxID=254410 RepID=UPI000426010A|nr:TIGR03826 family flagellar region protein [Alteribacter aurantiacus]